MTVFDDPELLEVSADEAQVMRVFAVVPGSPAEERLVQASGSGGEALAAAAGELLGGVVLDGAWLELLNRKDVEEMGGVEAYLKAGYDPPEAALEVIRPAISDAPRHLLLILSRAFTNRPVVLQPDAGLTGLAAVSLLRAPATATPMAADEGTVPLDAAPPMAKPQASKSRVSGIVALVALLVAAALVAAMVFVAG